MPDVQRGVVKAPNEMLQGLDQRRSMTPGPGAPATHDPNARLRNGSAGGSANLARSASPVSTPDHRFNVENAKMPQPPSATKVGTGAVPIYPYSSMGIPNQALPEADSAKNADFPLRVEEE
jgi:hypothetical protein